MSVQQTFGGEGREIRYVPAPGLPFGTAAFLSSALVSARVGTWQFDTATGLTDIDAVASSLIGLVPVPHSGASLGSVIEEDRERVARGIEQAVRDGTTLEIECRVRTAAGMVRWLYSLSRPVPTERAPARYLWGIVHDITERKEAQSALLERERQQSAILSSLPGVAYRCSLEPPWQMSFIGGAVETLTGHAIDEFLAERVSWAMLVRGDDAPALIEQVAAAIKTRSEFDFKYRIVRRDNEVRWVHERGHAVYAEAGEPLFLEGYIGDIHEQALAGENLRQAEERYRLVSQAAMEVIWDIDLATGEMTFNESITTVLRHEAEDICPTAEWWRTQVHPDDIERVSLALGNLILGRGSRYMGEHRFRRGDGTYADILTRCQVMRDAAGHAVRLLGSLMDLTELKLSDAALRESEAINRSIVDASIDCVMLFDLEGTIRFVNSSGVSGMEVEDAAALQGRSWESLWPGEIRPMVARALATARSGGVGRFTAAGQTARGHTKWGEVVVTPVLGEQGEVAKLVAISRDVTDRREAESRLLWSATRDPLTHLPNRALFQRTLYDAVTKAAARNGKVGLLVLDLDYFKQVNDTLGHDAGDALLKIIATRLEAFCARECGGISLVARLGGDEFAVIIDDIADLDELSTQATAALANLREPFVHAGRILDCHATVGAALFPDHGEQPEDLLKSADIALYAAKATLRGRSVIFEPVHRAELRGRQEMIGFARTALAADRILPFYQPKVRLYDRSVYGFEALLRWTDPTNAIQLPGAIRAAFEDLELAAAISDRIIDQVIVDMRQWLDEGVDFGHVAVNAAAAEFRSDRFAERVLDRLERADIPPCRLHLEVTETVFLGRGAEFVERALKLLSDSGVSIALDDFGTGFASLRHLKQFPVDVIKIDRSFVQNMESDPDDAAIIEAVLNLGKSLKIEVVAEGIETASQVGRLRELQCHYGQGFLFSHAVPRSQVSQLIHDLARSSL